MAGIRRFGLVAAVLAAALMVAQRADARSEEATIRASTDVLEQFLSLRVKEIPEALLSEAQAVVIIPDLIKVGFVLGGQRGTGIVVVRDANTGGWSAPSFVSLTGGSIGWQIGAQSSDIVLVFKTQRSVEGLLEGKFTLGADAAVAAGPVGRQAKAATDAQLKAEIYSYARSRGLFAGVAIDGSVLQIEHAQNIAYYGGTGVAGVAKPIPEAAVQLVQYIAQATANADAGIVPPSTEPGPTLTPSGPVIEAQPTPARPVPSNTLPSTTVPSPTVPSSPVPFNVPQGGNQPGPSLAPPRDQGFQPPSPDALRSRVAKSAGALNPLLDSNWQRYLALPGEVYANTGHPSATSLRSTVERYEAVAADPRYRDLNTRPEFQATRDALRAYLDSLGAESSTRLALPPPPTGAR